MIMSILNYSFYLWEFHFAKVFWKSLRLGGLGYSHWTLELIKYTCVYLFINLNIHLVMYYFIIATIYLYQFHYFLFLHSLTDLFLALVEQV